MREGLKPLCNFAGGYLLNSFITDWTDSKSANVRKEANVGKIIGSSPRPYRCMAKSGESQML